MIEGGAMFEPMDDDWDLLPGQPDPEDGESMALGLHGLLEDPINERDCRAADERDYYDDLALYAREERSERNQELTSHDLEDLDER
jgi:hypothetical protein